LKYEIAVDVYWSKVVWISGPHRGGKHDKAIFHEGLHNKIRPGKKATNDRVYGAKDQNGNNDKVALPNHMNSACPIVSTFVYVCLEV
jgi:hypothetical protein